MKKSIYSLIMLAGIWLSGCRERFDPPAGSLPTEALVVEGNLNAGQTGTTIHLSHATKLDQSAAITGETNALLTVEGENGTTSVLSEVGDGYYFSGNLNLTPGTNYRLRITTNSGKEYLSEYVKAKVTPEIDSISWKRTDKGVQIYANSHDPSNSTVYYRWDYDETWEQRSAYPPSIIYENGQIRDRVFPQEDVGTCWKNHSSTSILLANSLRLESDIINEAPIIFIPESDDRILARYSILVRQYAISSEAYNFFEIMKNNSEEIGNIFSPQPSEIRGNIHCTSDPKELVVGFITSSTVTEKRIFIGYFDVVPWLNPIFCESTQVDFEPEKIATAIRSGLLPYQQVKPPIGNYVDFSTPFCVDCTTRGGTTTRPSFW